MSITVWYVWSAGNEVVDLWRELVGCDDDGGGLGAFVYGRVVGCQGDA